MPAMLTSEDLKAIGTIVEEKVGTIIEEKVGTIVEGKIEGKMEELRVTIKEGFQDMEDRFQDLKKDFTGLENKFDGMGRKLDKVDGRLNTLVNVLEKKQVISQEDKLVIQA